MDRHTYAPSVRALHWLMAAILLVVFSLGMFMTPCKELKPWDWYSLHKSLGFTIFVLVWIRLAMRLRSVSPPAIEGPRPVQIIAAAVAGLLYVAMIFVPISGYALSNIHGFDVHWFFIPLPKLFPTMAEWEGIAGEIHELSAYAFLALILLHVAGMIKHHVAGQEVLRRIT